MNYQTELGFDRSGVSDKIGLKGNARLVFALADKNVIVGIRDETLFIRFLSVPLDLLFILLLARLVSTVAGNVVFDSELLKASV